jgi:hypothetical protein
MAERFHVSMIVNVKDLHPVTSLVHGRAYNVQITPVVEDEAPSAGATKTNGARIPVRDILEPWWARLKSFGIKDAIALATEHGFTKGAVYTAVLGAQKVGALKRIGPGQYQVLAKGRKAANKAPRNPDSTEHAPYILALLKDRGPMVPVDIRANFKSVGRAPRSMDGAIHRLKAKQLIKKDGDTYAITAKGTTELERAT